MAPSAKVVFRMGETVEQESAKKLLATIVGQMLDQHRSELERIRQQGRAEYARPDFIWHILLQSFATMGNSRGYVGLIQDESNYRRMAFDRLAGMATDARTQEVVAVCGIAGIRMPSKKAAWILSAFDRIQAMGGLGAAKEELSRLRSREEVEQFWRRFDGIGEKYSRNIMMDVDDPRFRDAIAIDARINRVSGRLGLTFQRPFPEHEAFYLSVAREAGMSGWELDRILYNFGKEVEAALETQGGTQ